MSVWLTMPSARPLAEVEALMQTWKARGYRIALWRDPGAGIPESCDFAVENPYPGYARACNELIGHVMVMDPEARWFVCAGDDTEPDPRPAGDIGLECARHFYTLACARESDKVLIADAWGRGDLPAFGVMQPTGDRDFGDRNGPYIDRVAGSPWIGREFARRMYGGSGPYWHEYQHMFVDAEIMDVAVMLGVFWQRPDLTHKHNHWGRAPEGNRGVPLHLTEANTPEHWRKFKAIYEARRAQNFPGHEPIL